MQDAILDGSRLYLNLTERSEWSGGIMPFFRSMPMFFGADELRIFSLGQKKIGEQFKASLGTESVEMMAVGKNRLFLNLPGDGILMLDVTDPARPFGRRFLRTLGYASGIELTDTDALIAAGHYGVYQIGLGSQQ